MPASTPHPSLSEDELVTCSAMGIPPEQMVAYKRQATAPAPDYGFTDDEVEVCRMMGLTPAALAATKAGQSHPSLHRQVPQASGEVLHLCTSLPEVSGGEVPRWVHLVPSGTFKTVDGRGPYKLLDAGAVIAASMKAGKLPIDENHAIDATASKGGPHPACGWIVAMEARQDGIWGDVQWTPAGRELVADQAYRGFSPAFYAPGGVITRIVRGSLTNAPNLPDLITLHSEGG